VTLPLANCLGIPVLTIGLRRYTNNENRGFAFGLFYVIMNFGALIAGPLVDILTRYYNNNSSSSSDSNSYGDESDQGSDLAANGEYYEDSTTAATAEWSMTSNRAIILSGVIANFFAVFVAFSVREIKVDANSVNTADEMEDESVVDNRSFITSNSHYSNSKTNTTVSSFQPIQGSSTLNILKETARSPNFRRFLLVVLLTLNVRMIFRHFWMAHYRNI